MVFVVAEIGVNWDGDPVLVKDMIETSKKIGCDAVKFQAFSEEMVKNNPKLNRLIKSTISKSNIETINNLAKTVGIEWFCTPMYPEAVDLLNPYVKRFKIRELDGRSLLKNEITDLLEKILQTGKEIIVSSKQSPRNSKFFKNPKIKWLYCVPKYPCDFSDLDFTNMKDFNGYSNHCPHFLAPLTAFLCGAELLEIHITENKSKDYIDNNVSLDYYEMKNLIELIRLVEKMKF